MNIQFIDSTTGNLLIWISTKLTSQSQSTKWL